MSFKMNHSLTGLVREKRPVIHCITNYVTAGDVANIILACGGSPIMADQPEEVSEITALSDCLLLNIGTPKETTKSAMIKAGLEANRRNLPVIFDPVGIGASRYRTEAALSLLKEVKITVIRGNASELRVLLKELTGQYAGNGSGPVSPSRGVDASFTDEIREDTLESLKETARALSAATGAVTVMTGATDIVSTGKEDWLIRNGCSQMSRITGSGCMLDGIIAAYTAAIGPSPSQNDILKAAALATAAAGLCGERAAKQAEQISGGTGNFRCCFLDEVSLLEESTLKGGIKIEIS
ncbi:hydroxyethylthiazole kinase [Lacrimispora celerecrescens]|uniref:Hydroxyethylthiazole kinase n=1 Tax=[Clostridium] celerecrescens 18A TaxID=1286362 RepID=A0A2M8ZCA7_9FIRM|nr:hydroxyethylthiazole kinase [Lacrimispora celerecrescens]PJJ31073.1 hydroxyethylthiazole kinase [[Clostridium] celerecrescens 18A]